MVMDPFSDPIQRLKLIAEAIDEWTSEGEDFLERVRRDGMHVNDRLTGSLGALYARGIDLIQTADAQLQETADDGQREVIEGVKKSFTKLLKLVEEFGKLPRSRS